MSAWSKLRIKKKGDKWEEEAVKERGSNLPVAVEGKHSGAAGGVDQRLAED